MSEFIGTLKEFKYFFDGYCKNKVNQKTAKLRKITKRCEYCGLDTVRQSAHKRGFERPILIQRAIDKCNKSKSKNIIHIDLEEFEKCFIDLHYPLEEHFYFLCHKCHGLYDSNKINDDEINILINKIDRFCGQIKKKEKTNKKGKEVDYTNYSMGFCNAEDLHKKENETIQNYIKRLLSILYNNNLLDEMTLLKMQNLDYCKTNFGLQYSLLEKDVLKISPAGRNRYYTTIKLGGIYYICSQWWKEKNDEYIYKLNKWVDLFIKEKGIK